MGDPVLKPVKRLPRLVLVSMLALASNCSPDLDSSDSASSRPRRESERTPPRVVLLISIDTLRADHVGIYGYARPTSPVIDRLGREGAVFDDAISTSPWTLPAHASMLTGLYPNRHGANDVGHGLAEGIPTLATILASRGYTTAAVVNSSKVGRLYDLQRGFQEFVYVQEVTNRVSPSSWITDQAMNWLREFREERLFLFVHYFDVHSDYTSLPEVERQFVSAYDGKADGSSSQLYVFGLDPAFLAECRE
ncbi:MAG: sulfatase-like hydrolase/transferase, partial [Myxococcota bacterium]